MVSSKNGPSRGSGLSKRASTWRSPFTSSPSRATSRPGDEALDENLPGGLAVSGSLRPPQDSLEPADRADELGFVIRADNPTAAREHEGFDYARERRPPRLNHRVVVEGAQGVRRHGNAVSTEPRSHPVLVACGRGRPEGVVR